MSDIWIENLEDLIEKEKNYSNTNYLTWVKKVQINFYRLYKVKSKFSNLYKLSIVILKRNKECFLSGDKDNHFKEIIKMLKKVKDLSENEKDYLDIIDADKVYEYVNRSTKDFYDYHKRKEKENGKKRNKKIGKALL